MLRVVPAPTPLQTRSCRRLGAQAARLEPSKFDPQNPILLIRPGWNVISILHHLRSKTFQNCSPLSPRQHHWRTSARFRTDPSNHFMDSAANNNSQRDCATRTPSLILHNRTTGPAHIGSKLRRPHFSAAGAVDSQLGDSPAYALALLFDFVAPSLAVVPRPEFFAWIPGACFCRIRALPATRPLAGHPA